MRRRLRRRLVEGFLVRLLRCVGYTAIALAGVLMVWHPDLFPPLYRVMGWFLIFGGGLSGLGSGFGRWAGEFMGLPLLAAAMASFSVLTVRDAGWLVGGPSVLLLAAYGGFMLARWLDVRAVGRSAVDYAAK